LVFPSSLRVAPRHDVSDKKREADKEVEAAWKLELEGLVERDSLRGYE
jgi:hypothetical protein